ncbi:TPA: ferritin, partial [Clostridioides difficile]|nr:ferritin [Clostridioides difficile]
RTSQFLLWFISEQAEEETNCEDNIKRVKLAGEGGLFFVDQEFANRTYAAPTNPPVTI